MEREDFREEQEPDLLEVTDDEGNVMLMQIVDYFFYNGQEYAIVADYDTEEEAEEMPPADGVDCFVMQVNSFTDENGEEFDEFVPIEDEELENRLITVARGYLESDQEADEEE